MNEAAELRSELDQAERKVKALELQVRQLQESNEILDRQRREVAKERDIADRLNRELEERIYKIGLLCDKVPGLEHGFCPDVGEPRDNVTRIKIALERFIEKRVEPQQKFDPNMHPKKCRVCGAFYGDDSCPHCQTMVGD